MYTQNFTGKDELIRDDKLVNHIQNLKRHYRNFALGDKTFSASDMGCDDDPYQYCMAKIIYLMHQFMKLRFVISWPKAFNPDIDLNVAGTNFSLEDFNRMAVFCRYIIRQETRKSGNSAGRWYRGTGKRSKNKKIPKAALEPYYMKSDDVIDVIDESTGRVIEATIAQSAELSRLRLMSRSVQLQLEELGDGNLAPESMIHELADILSPEEMRSYEQGHVQTIAAFHYRHKIELEFNRIDRISMAGNSKGNLTNPSATLRNLPGNIRSMIEQSARKTLSVPEQAALCEMLGEDCMEYIQPSKQRWMERLERNVDLEDATDSAQIPTELERKAHLEDAYITGTDSRPNKLSNMLTYEPSQREIDEFHELNRQMSVVGAQSMGYLDSAKQISVDPVTRTILPRVTNSMALLPHQVIGKSITSLPIGRFHFLPIGNKLILLLTLRQIPLSSIVPNSPHGEDAYTKVIVAAARP